MAIEFKGGTMLTYSYTGEIDTNAVKKTVEGENYGAVTVTTGSSMNSSLEVIEISFSSSEDLQQISRQLYRISSSRPSRITALRL